MKKKVLIITYYWPPAGGPGVQRWLKFTKYLPEQGILPVVYVPENPSYPLVDKNLLTEIVPEVQVIKQKISEPYRFAKSLLGNRSKTISAGMIPAEKHQTLTERFSLWVRGNFFIPDARVGWVKPSVTFLTNFLKEHSDIDTIITTGPPHSLHLIGLELQEALGVKWIADFRDPWTTIGYHKALKLSKRAEMQHKQLEKQVLVSADHILVTSPSTRQEFSNKTNTPITVITNGYDTTHLGKVQRDEKFTLSHIGSLLSDRNPRVLWKAISELRKENPDFKQDFQLKLVGRVSEDVLKTLNEFKLQECLENKGYLSNDEALKEMRASQVLLLIEIDSEETKAIIPGKLFEYMAAERPILAIGPEEADMYEIIQQTNTGKVALYSEKDKIREILLTYYEAYKNNNLEVFAMGLQFFSRKKLTQKLASVINNLK